MTPEERITAILNKKPHDCLSWTAMIDNNTLDLLPENLRGNYGIDFYKHIKCDIFLLNGWNTPYTFKSPELRWSKKVKIEFYRDNDKTMKILKMPEGRLKGIYGKGGHPIKYMVESIEDVRLYTKMWEDAEYIKHDDTEVFNSLERLVGQDGVITRFWGPSAIPMLIEFDMGLNNFYYLLADFPEEMKNLIEIIHEKQKKAFEILAQTPCSCVILVENTSTYYISPEVYKRFNMLHQQDFVKTIKKAGKVAILHMCGHVKNILHLIKETGCDGIHALTPPPTGDTPWELALEILGEETVIIGAVSPSAFLPNKIQDIPAALDRFVNKRLKKANFILGFFADGLRVEPERFYAISRWIEKNRF